VDLDDEGTSDGGEQTGLRPKSVHHTRTTCTTYEYQCRAQVIVMLLHKSPVVLLGLLVVMLVKFGAEALLW